MWESCGKKHLFASFARCVRWAVGRAPRMEPKDAEGGNGMATTHRIGLRRRLRHAASFMGMVALSALMVLLAQHLLTPSGARAQATCSNATLNGTYSALASGFSLFGADGAALPAPAPRVAIQLLTLDGSGNISRTGTRNNGGAIGPTDVSGTYAVNPDCRFSVTFTPRSE